MSGESHQEDFNKDRAELFEALGHPTRIKILQILSKSPLGFSDLKKEANIESNGLLSFHLNKLNYLVKTVEGNYGLTDEGREALRIMAKEPHKTDFGLKRHFTPLRVIAIILAVALIIVLSLNFYNGTPQNSPHLWLGLNFDFRSDPTAMRVEIQDYGSNKVINWYDVKMNGSTVIALENLSLVVGADYLSPIKNITLPDNQTLVWTVTLGFSDGMSLTHTRIWGPANFSNYYNRTDGTGTDFLDTGFVFYIPTNYGDNSWVESMP